MLLHIGKIKRIEPNTHTLKERWEIVGNKMRGRCGVPIKTFPYKRKSMNQISHLHGTFTRTSAKQDHLPIYNLRGVKVGTGWKALQRLPKGIYIIGGKKVTR